MSVSQYRSFFIPADDMGGASETLNAFLREHTILNIDRQFVAAPTVGWAFCVVYSLQAGKDRGVPKEPRPDYRALLGTEDQVIWDHLREWRASRAKLEGKKPYVVFSNAQLHYMISQRINTLSALAKVPDWGSSRHENYGEPLLAVLKELMPEDGEP